MSETSPAVISRSSEAKPLRWSFSPIFAPIILHRPTAAAIGIASAAQVCAAALHLPGIDCPLFRLTGIPCPGCGLSRACAAMLRGEPHHSVKMHAFAVPVLVGVAVLLVAMILPTQVREKVGRAVERAERKTGITSLLLGTLLLYWLARLLYAPHEFISLIGRY
jgi:hypothetical protein